MKLRIADCGLRIGEEEADSQISNPESQIADETGVTRREMMKLAAGVMIVPPVFQAKPRARKSQPKPRRFFTQAELAMVDELSELIIPADDHSPGARAAKAAEYIDQRLAESPEEEPKREWREGLKLIDQISNEMSGRSFMQASPEQRVALLVRIAQNETNPQKPEEKFFVELKSRVAHAYYTSKIGIHNELEYKGNTYLREFAGEDVSGK
ncbi:MAG: gluconate 2-dehydrogenase subunit 3 family protein [Acidobacteria bacterium]|nr:gluconate 2-dehydrogenase subunit 3 family protein [Acidobacteriota bacterium]